MDIKNNVLYRAWIRLVFPYKLSAFLDDKKVLDYVREAKENKLINDRMFEKAHYKWKDIDPLGIILYAAVRSTKPKVVIETGVQSGISSMYILMAMKANSVGVLYSVDLPDRDPKKVGEVVPDELKENWHLYLGDSKALLPQIIDEIKAPVDIFFHDSLHTYDHMLYEFEWGLKYLSEYGLITSHDILWNDAFDEFCTEHSLNDLKLYNIGLIKRQNKK
ncbi:Methyltransferase domain protein [uncultured archaeon]|nr:Methyltransferase domain protein [uncultured archaeon]